MRPARFLCPHALPRRPVVGSAPDIAAVQDLPCLGKQIDAGQNAPGAEAFLPVKILIQHDHRGPPTRGMMFRKTAARLAPTILTPRFQKTMAQTPPIQMM